MPARITHDESVNAAYVQITDAIGPGGSARTVSVDPVAIGGVVTLDLDDQGRIGGIEVLAVSEMLPASLLAPVTRTRRGTVRDLLRRSSRRGSAPGPSAYGSMGSHSAGLIIQRT